MSVVLKDRLDAMSERQLLDISSRLSRTLPDTDGIQRDVYKSLLEDGRRKEAEDKEDDADMREHIKLIEKT